MGLIDIALLPEAYEGDDARVMRWLCAPGEQVAHHQPLVEVETDKVTVEIAAPAAGRLEQVLKRDNDTIKTGDVLGRIQTSLEVRAGVVAAPDPVSAAGGADAGTMPARAAPAVAAAAGAAESAPGGGTREQRLSPAVRALLAERGADANAMPAGTGRDGRLTARDVEAAINAAARSQRVPHTAMRRRIATNMLASVSTSPHVTAVFEVNLDAVVAHRERHRAAFQARGVPLSFTAYFIAACVPALRAVPEVNGRFHADAMEIFQDLDLGIGTALGSAGLVVPVLRGVQHLDLFGIAQQLAPLLEKARSGKLTAADTRGGTLTLTNHGVSGSLIATPIIQQPQVAILGVGKIERRPAVLNIDGREQLGIATQCFASLTIDHRALDGFQANGFLSAWVKALECWPPEP